MPKDRRIKNKKNKENKGPGERPDSNSSAGDVEVQTDAADMMVGQDTDMATEDGQRDGTTNGPVEEAETEESHMVGTNKKVEKYPRSNEAECVVRDDVSEQLAQTFLELTFQNEFFKAQFDVLKDYSLTSVEACKVLNEKGDGENPLENVEELQEKIKSLTRELQEQKEMQIASDNALEHLQMAYSEADAKSLELSSKLTEAQRKMDLEIKQREEKYVELDSKFGRLLKRAKQRIQELQKEKDDLEIRFREVNEVTEKASSQQAAMQLELERTRQNANEALRSMDVERQQLRAANNKLRETADELRRLLEAKESALEGLQQSLFEKEHALEEMKTKLEVANEKREASISEISAKHQKQIQSLEGQIADALSDQNKTADTISNLQTVIAEKESKIAELEAASTGEAVRLRAVIEATKGEINQLKQEHAKERASWDASYEALKSKLEMAENTCLRSEIEAAKMRSQLELVLSVQNQLLNSRDADLAAAKEEINRLEREFSSYKVRAHALLQKKNEELDEANIKAKEEAIKEAQRELAMATAERDKAIQDLQDALSSHDEELATRDAALTDAEQRIRRIELKLESANTRYLSEKEEWQRSIEKVEETWRLKYETLEAQKNEQNAKDLEVELEEFHLQHKRLQEEHKSFRDLADRMMEDKDKEISKLLEDNKNLHQSLASRPLVGHMGNQTSTLLKQEDQPLTIEASEQQILLLARQQAQREEELAQSQRHILALQEEIEELERENRLHGQQEAMLKAELRNMERSQKREGIDMTYLKNVILKLLETGEVEALLPVIGMLLQFSPEEIKKCQQAYSTSSEGPAPADDTPVPRSLFSRFTFT